MEVNWKKIYAIIAVLIAKAIIIFNFYSKRMMKKIFHRRKYSKLKYPSMIEFCVSDITIENKSGEMKRQNISNTVKISNNDIVELNITIKPPVT